ncbi:thiopeptide-type bacteriocin biosynthesis protein [Frankia sp. CNm7]|uniref:Thiopeptide-type bacteriocin biosynthesis protein n=1 Tax=Frankia nepalensis TaxID=1836974 RepID=A0A937URC4_9ACTN|nr:thiopeptide-type bacteriocin biosynthesis protein [Frankia nepalensis]MBL7496334.1 thiopeptide-type bacteriocin biosynthesis protein [Frankia nepalensis]MBL7508469.1 thiopeptide-type bacteriocin biosynthesis protein [Frankia nepalensis]MBL7521633.1 thiopeptide-type bacteriocin biosynthesis protein [Frankia nepalensis]MBL7627601.1 thiopeptide-type bacteriocin biosynthesis protein [Frankia nepalensis]
MHETPWKQLNITYPGPQPREREDQAINHLARVLPGAEADGLITSWFFIRKGAWRVRYLTAQDTGGHHDTNTDRLHALLTDGIRWTAGTYEPEIHAFGGPSSMNAAHELFHHDSTHLLSFLATNPPDRREHSLVLCTALMRTAGLDLNEQGDVWARIAEQRSPFATPPPDPQLWASFTNDVHRLLVGEARADLLGSWLNAFEETGRTLRNLREYGQLTRGIRAVIALHVIFHWNRLGLPTHAQAALAAAARHAIFGPA